MFTSAFIVLAVGLDPAVTDAHRRPTRSGGVFLHLASTTTDALTMLRTGDFDLVLLGPSLQPETRRDFVSDVRRLGLSLPVVYARDETGDCSGCVPCNSCTETTVVSGNRPIDAAVPILLRDGPAKIASIRPPRRAHSVPRTTAA